MFAKRILVYLDSAVSLALDHNACGKTRSSVIPVALRCHLPNSRLAVIS